MSRLQKRRALAVLLVVAITFSTMPFLPGLMMAEESAGKDEFCNLSDFLQDIKAYDLNGIEAEYLIPGWEYKFVAVFSETIENPFSFTSDNAPHPDGLLVYKIPAELEISATDNVSISGLDNTYAKFETIYSYNFIYANIGSEESTDRGLSNIFGNILGLRANALERDDDSKSDYDSISQPSDEITSTDGELIAGTTVPADEQTATVGDVLPEDITASHTEDEPVQTDEGAASTADGNVDDVSDTDTMQPREFELSFTAMVSEDSEGFVRFSTNFMFDIVSEIGFAETMGILEIAPFAASQPWNLYEFVTGVTITDLDGVNLGSNAPVIGKNYKIAINFAEDPAAGKQLSYDGSPETDPANTVSGLGGRVLIYRLPATLVIQNAIPQTPIRFPGTNAIIGWYTIEATNAAGVPGAMLRVWFANVDSNGRPTSDGSNFIDYYSNVELTLEITAQFTADSDDNMDFGDGIVINVPEPTPPPASLTVNKTSSYRPDVSAPPQNGSEGVIYYMVAITALGQPIDNLIFTDTLTVNGLPIINPIGNNAVSAPTFHIQRDDGLDPGSIVPQSVDWTENPASFTATFEPDLTLEPNEFITVRFHLDIQRLIANNPGIAPSLWNYSFSVENEARADGQDPSDSSVSAGDSTADHVGKAFEIHKSGAEANIGGQRGIMWSVVVGGDTSPNLVGGNLFDILDDALVLPASNSGINIKFYNRTTTAGQITYSSVFDGTAATIAPLSSFVRSPGIAPVPPSTPPVGWDFALSVPNTYGPVYKIEISYFTPFANQFAPQIPEQFGNRVLFFEPGGTQPGDGRGDVLVNQGYVTMEKRTSGLCGHPSGPIDARYWIDYEVEVIIPGGLQHLPLYLYDTLGRNPGGSGVPNVPQPIPGIPSMVVAERTDGQPLMGTLHHTDFVPYSTNSWRMFFGFTGNTIPAGESSEWQFNEEIRLTLNYRIYIPDSQIAEVKANSATCFQNTIYLMNQSGSGNPQIGNPEMRIAAVNTNDYWPIFKKGTPSANAPWVFDYTVTINGAYSSTNPFFRPPANPEPVFADSFDSDLRYVAGSFYMVNTQSSPNRYYAFPQGLDVTLGTDSFTANLDDLRVFTGSRPEGGWTGSGSALPPDWLNVKQKFEIRYQLEMVDPSLLDSGAPPTLMQNTASIARSISTCTFDNDYTVSYDERRLSKEMVNTPDGSGLTSFEIVINPDGTVDFGSGTGASPSQGPDELFAVDVLSNLMLYMDSVKFFTKTQQSGGTWSGDFTVEMSKSFNSRELWSVNSGTPDDPNTSNTVFFVIPNRQPVKIVYDALVTLSPGTSGAISNMINLEGESDGVDEPQWEVGDAGAGAVASRQIIRVFKRDNVGNNIKNATFDLYATNINMSGAAGGLPPVSLPNLNQSVQFGSLLTDVVTDSDGVAEFNHELLITRPAQFLFVLHERIPPDGYETFTEDGYTFFTIAPGITQAQINSAAAALGIHPDRINQIPDFITVRNDPIGPPNSLRIIKRFLDTNGNPLPEELLRQHLQNFELTVTDNLAVRHVFSLEDILNPNGIIIEDIDTGRFHFTENYFDEIPNYAFSHSTPNMPFHRIIFPNPTGPVTVMITNVYHAVDLRVQKSITGLTDTQINEHLQDLSIIITGPAGPESREYRFTLEQVLAGEVVLRAVTPGDYTITEENAEIDGFYLDTSPQLPQTITVVEGEENEVVFEVENVYTGNPTIAVPLPGIVPPTSPPSDVPQTGDYMTILLYVALLVMGVTLIAAPFATNISRKFFKRNK